MTRKAIILRAIYSVSEGKYQQTVTLDQIAQTTSLEDDVVRAEVSGLRSIGLVTVQVGFLVTLSEQIWLSIKDENSNG